MLQPPRLPRKPEARTEKVEDLVERVLRGIVRVPRFQRGLKWQASDVEKLFDSLYRGYPVGSLLFYKRPATAEHVHVGPLRVDAPEVEEAWWVVDGQQRVTSLAACLARAEPIPTAPQDPYVLYFDCEGQKFVKPPKSGEIPDTWVPLPVLLDASRLQDWVFEWQYAQNEELRRVVFEAGARIREYPIPLYLIEAEDEQVAEQIFYRVNQAGKSLEWTEVHDALFGGAAESPSTLAELSDDLRAVGMGRLEDNRLLTCLLALRGADPTRNLAEHYDRDPEVLRHAVQDALPVLRRVLSFLRRDAHILHLRLLPKSILLDVLTRFFACHPEPAPRTRALLARWFWRAVLGAGAYDDRTLRRRGIQAVGDDEEESVQRLLRLLRRERPRGPELPPSFDARADATRIALLALVHLQPVDLVTLRPLDVVELLEREDKNAFAKILKRAGIEGAATLANRTLQPSDAPVRQLLLNRIAAQGFDTPALRSHAVEPRAAGLLAAGDLEGFLARRHETLTEELRRFAERVAAWDHTDRPSIEHLLQEAGVEA